MIESGDGEDGLLRASIYQPALIVLDLELADLDGLAVVRSLRGARQTARIPILALSSDEPHKRAAADAGCSLTLDKPCPPDQLLVSARLFLNSRRHR